MTKIFIDTNIFLNFYGTNNDGLTVLDEILKHKEHLVLHQQVIDEFLRNRESVLRILSNNFKKEDSKLPTTKTSIMEDIPEFSKLIEIKKEYEKVSNVVSSKIDDLIKDIKKDKVADKVLGIYQSKKNFISTNSTMIQKAHERKLVGNPPLSSDKFTIGDEIIWEGLLGIKEDLVIVTRDNGFVDHTTFLIKEFREKTSKELTIVSKFKDAASKAKVSISKAVQEAEDKSSSIFNSTPNGWWVTNSKGSLGAASGSANPTIIVSKNAQTGLLSLLPESSMRCNICGANRPWNGARCLTCGHLDYE